MQTMVNPQPGRAALEAPTGRLFVRRRGPDLIAHPLLNKGTAFTDEEREQFGLRGLLPDRVSTIEEQVALELEHIRRKDDDLERYIGLAATQDRNETLFYRLLIEHLEEFAPIVYTPTVGRACQEFSHIFRKPRGIWITPNDVGRIDEILSATAQRDVRLIVITDNERILGLGDQGAGGMGIPVGKLALYTAAAGIYPAWTLPISLDVGTDNRQLLDDPLYLGYREPRLRGAAYEEVVEAFVEAVGRVFPRAVVQWEDFKQHNALRVLGRYRHRIACFNDDVQGTGAVVLAGLLAARRRQGGLRGERILSLGAGAAAIGISTMILRQLESEGADPDELRQSLVLMDSHGVVHLGREKVADDQRAFALSRERVSELGLTDAELADPAAVARAFHPTILLGTTGKHDAFSEALIREVGASHPQPIVMPLSNPSSASEAQPADIMAWTDGRALVATGSPFPDVEIGGARRLIGQANNVFVFPGVGLGAIVAEARELTDEAFLVAAHRLSTMVEDSRLAAGALYPPIPELRMAARAIAIELVRHFRDTGYGRQYPDDEIELVVDRAMWWPDYLPFETAPDLDGS
jgi:malic enzyme